MYCSKSGISTLRIFSYIKQWHLYIYIYIYILVLESWNDFQASSVPSWFANTANKKPITQCRRVSWWWRLALWRLSHWWNPTCLWRPQKICWLSVQCWISISVGHLHLTGQQQLFVTTQTPHSNVRMSCRNGRGRLEHALRAPKKSEYPKCWAKTLLELKNRLPSHQHSHNLADFLSPLCFFSIFLPTSAQGREAAGFGLEQRLPPSPTSSGS